MARTKRPHVELLQRPLVNGRVCLCLSGRVFLAAGRPQACNLQIMFSLLMAMALKTNLPQPGTGEAIFFGACRELVAAKLRLARCRDHAYTASSPFCLGEGVGVACAYADVLLSATTGCIMIIGSVSLVTCIRKKAKTAAKMGKKLRARKSKPSNKAQVHPL